MKKGRKWKILLLVIFLAFLGTPVYGEEAYGDFLEASGVKELAEALPEEAQNKLGEWNGDFSVDIQAILKGLLTDFWAELALPIKSLGKILAALLLCALLGAMGKGGTADTAGVVGVLFLSLTAAVPIAECIQTAADMVKGAAAFLLACAPVLAGLSASSGQAASAAVHSVFLFGAGNALSFFSLYFMVPLLQVFLMFSLVCAFSENSGMKSFCEMFYKAAKWILGFLMTVFSALLCMQSIFASGTDAVTLKAAKFTVSGFVPIVGSALSDAITAVSGSLKALRSGVSAFGVLGVFLTVAPIMLRCFSWFLVCTGGGAAAGFLGVNKAKNVLEAIGKCVEMILLILLCCLVVMTVISGMIFMGGKE